MSNTSWYDHNITLTDRLFHALSIVFVAKAKPSFTVGDAEYFMRRCLRYLVRAVGWLR